MKGLPEGYHLRGGKAQDRRLLRRFLLALFAEQWPGQTAARSVDGLLARVFDLRLTPLWWVMQGSEAIGCLWLGRAWDQFSGTQNSYIHLLYVQPEHRRRGIGRFLIEWASEIARDQGDSQLTLQSLPENTPALSLYRAMGFQTRALFLTKTL
ncbi:GNAT family N-acetyltransferase [Gloeobacter kilaueensis]|uniref:GCN5-related N-acetyltransferase n=1 Tax=Gloeobacter kilaueensis (strain ATCC BAA-2537 / CCAP 1431/1 / ULC 316 / JS1) TaxID=1183438 RepID=U5QLP4_GLOK1|nr:GNAT family N-acetyltransferase [Gloeobacter kilaueensis]AGY58539.1 GCN5-related N-acetyltransferase [Gloeobacter kilaueensis JS1]